MFLFNNKLNTFYGVGHMVKDHSDSERGRNEMFYLNDALNTFYLRFYGVTQIVREEGTKEMFLFNHALNTFYLWYLCYSERGRNFFYLTIHSTHFIYGFMASHR